MSRVALLLVYVYQQVLSPYLRSSCRYTPSCSQYAYECIERYGVIKGAWFTVCRLGRCHPLSGSGYDPVP